METFFSFLSKRVDDCSSLLCVGLDPHPSDLPAPTAEAARTFCLNIIKTDRTLRGSLQAQCGLLSNCTGRKAGPH